MWVPCTRFLLGISRRSVLLRLERLLLHMEVSVADSYPIRSPGAVLSHPTASAAARAAATCLADRWWSEARLVFAAGFLAYAFMGWIAAYVLRIYNWDGVSRIAQAYGVIFSRDPHLAALGLIWPPLPPLTELPLLFVLKPLGLLLLAGTLMGAFYTAVALAQLSQILGAFGIPRPWRLLWMAAFASHPLILHNGAMGLSEAPFLAFLLLSLNGFMRWERDGRPGGLIWAGFGSALALGCRYEALAWVAATAAAVAWQLWLRSGRLWSQRAAGSIVALVTPAAWALGLWVLMNWEIMGDPIFFLIGPGSTSTIPDTAHMVGPSHPFAYAQGSVVGSLLLVLRETVDLAPLLLPASALLLLFILWRFRGSDLAYLALGWSILGFTFLIALRGFLPPFTRYFFWVVPAGLVVACAAYRAAPGIRTRQLALATTTSLVVFQVLWLPLQAWPRLPHPFPLRVVSAMVVAPETVDYVGAGDQLAEFAAMASFLNSQPVGTTTLIDASVGSSVVFFVERPRELVLTPDRDFFPTLHSPVGRVDQVLVPRPTFDSMGRSEVLKYYPALYDGGEEWACLRREFPGPSAWRLYEVLQPGQPCGSVG